MDKGPAQPRQLCAQGEVEGQGGWLVRIRTRLPGFYRDLATFDFEGPICVGLPNGAAFRL